eukprot:3721343-Pleurochrysis_carterae.AAC.3
MVVSARDSLLSPTCACACAGATSSSSPTSRKEGQCADMALRVTRRSGACVGTACAKGGGCSRRGEVLDADGTRALEDGLVERCRAHPHATHGGDLHAAPDEPDRAPARGERVEVAVSGGVVGLATVAEGGGDGGESEERAERRVLRRPVERGGSARLGREDVRKVVGREEMQRLVAQHARRVEHAPQHAAAADERRNVGRTAR